MSKRSAWLIEYEQLCNSATSIAELQDLSIQYISRQREDFLSQIERYKTETEQSHADGERSHVEAEKLRDALKRLRTELEVRASRFARTDHEDLRAIVSSGLRQASCETSVAEGSSGNVMKRLRARVEQLERANKKLEKECDALKLQKLVAQRDLQRAGLEQARTKSTSASGIGLQQRSPRNSSRSLIDDSLANMPSPRATASSPPRVTRSFVSIGEEADAKAAPIDERERRWTGEREHLLTVVQHMEKEQVEQQEYADKVMNQLGHALRALEADNASLQEESKQQCQKLGASVEARRKLDRQVRQLRAEKEALARQVLSLRAGPHSESKAIVGHARHSRVARSKSPNAVSTGSNLDKLLGRNVGSGVAVADKLVSQASSQQDVGQRRPESLEIPFQAMQELPLDVEVSPSMEPRQSRGLAWRSFESDGTLEDSPMSEPLSQPLTPFTSSSTLLEAAPVSEDVLPVSEESMRGVLRVDSEPQDRATQPATPAWAVISVSPAELLPRVPSPGRVDVKPRPGRTSSSPKRFAHGASATNPRIGSSRSPRTSIMQTRGVA